MGIRVKRRSTNVSPVAEGNTEYSGNDTREQRETTVDGYTFHWGPNETRNFLDEGVGRGHAAFQGAASIVADETAFGEQGF